VGEANVMKAFFSIRRILFAITLATVLAIGYLTIFGERGLLQLRERERELAEVEGLNARAGDENEKLKKRIILLKKNPQYVEETARKELGVAGSDEIIYQFEQP
jgi:cell division protein FtsB